ncbi:hypothetical protein E2C01_060639 [Portunus trituberculatus]|uniref:Uncharacterized protein n=1 Tax=Portunus trituberculatus TaxID=210409 RepID=A0A5B7H1R1_PORTR|nr:hypothetical protein [Portunus trituberculatus]
MFQSLFAPVSSCLVAWRRRRYEEIDVHFFNVVLQCSKCYGDQVSPSHIPMRRSARDTVR